MTTEEKLILRQEIPKYIQQHCYDRRGDIKCEDLWLVGWVYAEVQDRKNAMRVLISNEYGLLGNLLHKLARDPDPALIGLMERCDLEVLLKALRMENKQVLYRNDLDEDPYAMRLLIAHDKKYIKDISDDLLHTKPFLLSIVSYCPEVLENVLPNVLNDETFAFSLIQKNCACLKYLPRKFLSDHALCLEAARQEGFSLMYIDFELRNSDEIVLAAVSNRGNDLFWATARQKKDRNIVSAAVENCGLALDYADDIWKSDFELVSKAVANKGMALRFAAAELQDNEEIVRLAAQNDSYAIRFASPRLQDHEEIAKLALLESGEVKPVILFFDEINRTDTSVFRELMNIILTRSVNGYRFPWWVMIMAAMNPSTQTSMYATNEMDPAQLDRFIKIKVHEDATEWADFAIEHHFDRSIIEFIMSTPGALSPKEKLLEDDEIPLPSPRGWHMVDLILKGRDKLDRFFSAEERRHKDKDIRAIISAKVGGEAGAMFYSSLSDPTKLVLAEEIFCGQTEDIPQPLRLRIKQQSTAKSTITSKSIVTFLKDNAAEIAKDAAAISRAQKKIALYMGLLDMSGILMFAQSLISAETPAGTSLYDYFYEVFDDELLELLQRNNMNDALVRGEL